MQKRFDLAGRDVLVAGRGFLGGSLAAALRAKGARVSVVHQSGGVDLRDGTTARRIVDERRPELIVNAAAHQGGIGYIARVPATVYFDNLMLGAQLMEAARAAGVTRYVDVLAGCIYPGDLADLAFREEDILSGPLHPTVEAYAATRRAQIAQATAYRKQHGMRILQPVLANMYGPGDHFDLERSHALAALLRRYHEAKERGAPDVVVWGSGRAVREWLYVGDAVEAIVALVEADDEADPVVNVGTGVGTSIADLALAIARIVGYRGATRFDTSKPDGAMHKVLDVRRLRERIPCAPATPVERGIEQTYRWYLEHHG